MRATIAVRWVIVLQSVPLRNQDNICRQRVQQANVVRDDNLNKKISREAQDILVWLIDSGATQHMSHSTMFMSSHKTIDSVNVHLADDGVAQFVVNGAEELF